jgi:pyruvate dehydrogenase E2 component (dihydrolipoamide acetyltransferase)
MAEAWRTIPAVTLHRSVSFGPLLGVRESLAIELGRKPAVDVILARLVAITLTSHPLLSGSWRGEAQAVFLPAQRNVAIAVDTPGGLTIVVLRDADERTIPDLDADLRAMLERARAGRARPADVAGATFTITNLGALGVEQFDPIITPPQAGVLGVGAVRGSGAAREATLSLTFDHRVVDGADGARFLADLAAALEAPAGWGRDDQGRSEAGRVPRRATADVGHDVGGPSVEGAGCAGRSLS